MTIDEWLRLPRPTGKWAYIARQAIREVIEVLMIGAPQVLADPAETLVRIDAAYPFDIRRHYPYKQWLTERRLIRSVLASPEPPSKDEADVCEVARDMELEGRDPVEIRAVLDEQAPNRLALRCPACGAPPLITCADLARPIYLSGGHDALLVPHQARLIPR